MIVGSHEKQIPAITLSLFPHVRQKRQQIACVSRVVRLWPRRMLMSEQPIVDISGRNKVDVAPSKRSMWIREVSLCRSLGLLQARQRVGCHQGRQRKTSCESHD